LPERLPNAGPSQLETVALKSEARKPKAERRPKTEIRKLPCPTDYSPLGCFRVRKFGLRISFGFRHSAFGF